MKSIREGQSSNVNDTCTDCGSFADIGAVIDEQDTLLEIVLVGDDAQVKADDYTAKAQARFDDVVASLVTDERGLVLSLNFAFSAEKMIFQLQNQL